MDIARSKLIRTVTSSLQIALCIAALVVTLAGWSGIGMVLLVPVLLLSVVGLFVRTPTVPMPELTDEDVTAIRTARDENGEIPAVRAIRKRHPGLSLGQAVTLVRSV